MKYRHVVIAHPGTLYDQLFQNEEWNWVYPTEEIKTEQALIFMFVSPTPLTVREISSMLSVAPDVWQCFCNLDGTRRKQPENTPCMTYAREQEKKP